MTASKPIPPSSLPPLPSQHPSPSAPTSPVGNETARKSAVLTADPSSADNDKPKPKPKQKKKKKKKKKKKSKPAPPGSLERLLQDNAAEEILPELLEVNVTEVADLANLTKEMLLSMSLEDHQKDLLFKVLTAAAQEAAERAAKAKEEAARAIEAKKERDAMREAELCALREKEEAEAAALKAKQDERRRLKEQRAARAKAAEEKALQRMRKTRGTTAESDNPKSMKGKIKISLKRQKKRPPPQGSKQDDATAVELDEETGGELEAFRKLNREAEAEAEAKAEPESESESKMKDENHVAL